MFQDNKKLALRQAIRQKINFHKKYAACNCNGFNATRGIEKGIKRKDSPKGQVLFATDFLWKIFYVQKNAPFRCRLLIHLRKEALPQFSELK